MKRVLIAEDEVLVAMDLKIELSKMGYLVIGTSLSAEDTIQITREEKPDIILMDIHLRGATSGLQAAEEIQDDFAVPILFITAAPDNSILENINNSKKNGLLTKPFSREALHTAIDQLLK